MISAYPKTANAATATNSAAFLFHGYQRTYTDGEDTPVAVTASTALFIIR